MKVPNWLYVILVSSGLGGLTLLLSVIFSFILYPMVTPDFGLYIFFLAPFLISLPITYAIFSQRFRVSAQQRLLAGILLVLIGIIMFLVGIDSYWASFGFWNPLDPFLDILIGIMGLPVIIIGFWLALPRKGESNYLPAAGVSTLIATLLTFIIMFLSIPTALSSCPGSPSTCPPTTMVTIGVFSAVGFLTGIGASASLLKGRYHDIVPVGITLLALAGLFTLSLFPWWVFLAAPIAGLCVVSLAFAAWNQKGSLRASDWLHIGIFLGSLSVVAIISGVLLFFDQVCLPYPSLLCIRPYAGIAFWIISLGTAGMLSFLLSIDNARLIRSKAKGLIPTIPRVAKRSRFFQLLVVLLGVNLGLTLVLSSAVIGPPPSQCRGYCRAEQLTITQITFGSTPGEVTFGLTNNGGSDYTITLIIVQSVPFNGTVNISPPWIIPSGWTVSLPLTFSNVTFQRGVRYDFILVSSQGNKFPASGIP